MDKEIYKCPICFAKLQTNARYPNYICNECSKKTTDINGRKLIFSNVSFSVGYIANYEDTDEEYNSHVCYIDGIKCRADEARFGGIVIEKE